MNAHEFHEALHFLDDDLIEEVDALRRTPSHSHIVWLRAGVAAAITLTVGIMITAHAIGLLPSFLSKGSDGAENVHDQVAVESTTETEEPDQCFTDNAVDNEEPQDQSPALYMTVVIKEWTEDNRMVALIESSGLAIPENTTITIRFTPSVSNEQKQSFTTGERVQLTFTDYIQSTNEITLYDAAFFDIS